jgi:hypothetical protein
MPPSCGRRCGPEPRLADVQDVLGLVPHADEGWRHNGVELDTPELDVRVRVKAVMSDVFHGARLLLIVALPSGCSIWPELLPPRPPNVPPDAVRLRGGEAQWWVKFTYRSRANLCTVFNSAGVVLDDNAEYRPYDGGAPIPEQELRIDPKRSMPSVLYLENGRVIISVKGFDLLKQAVDASRSGNR